MNKYAILCGVAPNDYRQKKLVEKQDFLEQKEGYEPGSIIVFPNGVKELLLEGALNSAFDNAAEEENSEVLLYICTKTVADANAKMADVDVDCDVVLLGTDEIRKDVLTYYEDLSKKLEINFTVAYDVCAEYISEEELGYENVEQTGN